MAEEVLPDSKRQRLEHVTAPHQPATAAAAARQKQQQLTDLPSVTCLIQVPAGLPREPSPGAMHACRIAAWFDPSDSSNSTYGSVLASGQDVFWSQLQLQDQQHLQAEQHGKEGVLLPLRLQAPAVHHLPLPRHAGEVQSVVLCSSGSTEHPGELLLATVDAYGAGSIGRLRLTQEYARHAGSAVAAGSSEPSAGAAAGPATPPEVLVQSAIQPVDTSREGGWAGVVFSGSGSSSAAAAAPSLFATARCFAKDVCVYDAATAKAVRTFACMQSPYDLTFLPAGAVGSSSDASILAVAEGHAVALWDVRAAGAAGGCVQRFNPGALGQPLYSLAWSTAQAGLLGAAGAERSLYLAEPRKWRVVHKWHSATRLAIHSLSFLERDPRCAVLAGLDLEVVCGRWDAPGGNVNKLFDPSSAATQAEDTGAAAAAAAAAGRDAAGAEPGAIGVAEHAAPGAPGSGDRSRKGSNAAVLAAGGKPTAPTGRAVGPNLGGGVGMDVDEGEGSGATGLLSFRGDGRWLGVSKAVGADVLAGYAASGNLVYARIA